MVANLLRNKSSSHVRRTELQILWLLIWVLALLLVETIRAAQSGPVFPTHRFPTDSSFHLGYNFSALGSSSNFVSARTTDPLLDKGSLSIKEHVFCAEFQPNRQLSVGAFITLDQVKVSDINGGSASSSGFGDQRIFSEFRFFDEAGKSAGLAVVAKFPGYKNPTVAELNSQRNKRVALRGDAQTDISTLLTSELWLSEYIRTRMDAGFTYRTEQYSSEVPFLLSLAYVNSRFDFDLRFRGNASLNNDSFAAKNSDLAVVQDGFVGSQYALSNNPWTLIIEPTIEYWVSPKFAFDIQVSKSLIGNSSPDFSRFGIGMVYRFASTKGKARKTFQEVNIETDQDSGKFQGENQDRVEEPKALDARPISQEPDEEFFEPRR